MSRLFRIFLCVGLVSNGSLAQTWVNSGSPYLVHQMRATVVDNANNILYAAGHVSLDGSGSLNNNNTILTFDGLNWDTLGLIDLGLVYDLAIYQGNLYVAGSFDSINHQDIGFLAMYDGSQWTDVGGSINFTVNSLREINGDLYAVGGFTEVGSSLPVSFVARFDGTSWYEVPNLPTWSSGGPGVIASYAGDLYLGGSFTTATGITDLVRYDEGSTTWVQVGNGDHIQGPLAAVFDMIEYDGELFVGGSIYKGEGNVGHGIQKWNGSSWTDVGASMQDVNNTYTGNATVMKLDTAYGYLWAGGIFSYAGFSKTDRLSCWNGTQWCGDSTADFDGGNIIDFAFFNDTLYVATGDTVNGIFVNDLAKWTGGHVYMESCSSPVSTNNIPVDPFNLYPNPSGSVIQFDLPDLHGTIEYRIVNNIGQEVANGRLESHSNNIDVSHLTPGLYTVIVQIDHNILRYAMFTRSTQ